MEQLGSQFTGFLKTAKGTVGCNAAESDAVAMPAPDEIAQCA
jgi:hypothetical protein